jgi:hypothetical protein
MLYLLPLLFKRFYDEQRWTKGKFFIFAFSLCLMIGVVNTQFNYFVMRSMYPTELSYLSYFNINILSAYLVGTIPTTVGYFLIRNQRLRYDLQEKEDQNRKLIDRVRDKDTPDEKIITLCGNTKDSLSLFPSEFLYIESVSNYVYIFYKQDDRITQKKLRATLHQIEDLLRDYPFLVRCHRAFIINIYQIEAIKGLKLRLKSTETEIPISKTYKSDIQKQLK